MRKLFGNSISPLKVIFSSDTVLSVQIRPISLVERVSPPKTASHVVSVEVSAETELLFPPPGSSVAIAAVGNNPTSITSESAIANNLRFMSWLPPCIVLLSGV